MGLTTDSHGLTRKQECKLVEYDEYDAQEEYESYVENAGLPTNLLIHSSFLQITQIGVN